jgi:cell division protein FtsW (lipid II flippase)
MRKQLHNRTNRAVLLLLSSIVLLLMLSLLNVYSVNYKIMYGPNVTYGPVFSQLVYIVIGVSILFAVSRYKMVHYLPVISILFFFTMVAVFPTFLRLRMDIPLYDMHDNSNIATVISAGGLLILAMMLMLEAYLSEFNNAKLTLRDRFFVVNIIVLPCLLLYARLRAMDIIICIVLAVVIVFTMRKTTKKQVIIISTSFLIGMLYFLAQSTYFLRRAISLMPDYSNIIFVSQMVLGIGSGGVFGSGYLKGVQKYSWLPYLDSQFALVNIGEELGFIGLVATLILYIIIVYCCVLISGKIRNTGGKSLARAVTIWLSFQIVLSYAGIVGYFPGSNCVPPFLGAGILPLLSQLFAVGVLLHSYYHDDSSRTGNSPAL